MRSPTPATSARRAPIALTIAGSDSSGGAGIQADLKTFSALGVYGCSVVTALTAQNTLGVQAIHGVEPAFVRRQMDSVLGDLDVAAVKIGMLATAEIVAAVADGLEAWRPPLVVLDPVMVAKGGDRLLRDEAVAALRERLLPLAHLITPNLPEAGALLRAAEPGDRAGMEGTAERLLGLGPANVLLKGGHLAGATSPDLLLSGGERLWLEVDPDRDPPHPRHRLHPVLGDRGAAGPWPPAARRRRRGQALADRGDRRGRWSRHRPRYRAGSPFPCPVADPRRGRNGCLTRRPA